MQRSRDDEGDGVHQDDGPIAYPREKGDGERSSQRSLEVKVDERLETDLPTMGAATRKRTQDGHGPSSSSSPLSSPHEGWWCETEEEADAYLLREASLLVEQQMSEHQEGGHDEPQRGPRPETIRWTRQVGTVRDSGYLVEKTYDHVRGRWRARVRANRKQPPASLESATPSPALEDGSDNVGFDDENTSKGEELRDEQELSTNHDDLEREIDLLQQQLRLLQSEYRRSPKAVQNDGHDEAFDEDDDVQVDAELGEGKQLESHEFRNLLPMADELERQGNLVRPGAVRVFPDGGGGQILDAEDDDNGDEILYPEGPQLYPHLPARQSPPSARRSDTILLEANLVEETPNEVPSGAPEMVVYEARIVRRKQQVLAVAGIVLVASIAVALAVGLPMRAAQESAAASSSAKVPDDLVPVASLKSLKRNFTRMLSASTLDAVNKNSTAQAEAYRWLFAGDHPDLPKDEALPRMVHRFSLASVFYATGGNDSWRINAGWLEKDLHECLWHGVNCTGVSEDAVKYCKDEQGKLDQVSSRIRNVTDIETLDLSSNGIKGSIPQEISLLRTANIKSILMRSNSLSHPIPSEVGELLTLKTLSLSQNALSGTIPSTIGSLRALEKLQLDQNVLRGTTPLQFNNLIRLVELQLSQNQLTGSNSIELAGMSALQSIVLSQNWLGGDNPFHAG